MIYLNNKPCVVVYRTDGPNQILKFDRTDRNYTLVSSMNDSKYDVIEDTEGKCISIIRHLIYY